MAPSSTVEVPRPVTQPVSLDELAATVEATIEHATLSGLDAGRIEVTGLTAASDVVRPGDLFAALPGARAHGARFASAALAAGAIAVLTDAAGLEILDTEVPTLMVRDVRAVLGAAAARVYGRPSRKLTMLGVTGTSGKTTTTFLIRAGLEAAGRTSGLIGTVATMIGADELSTGFTTPEAPELQALLAVMLERGVHDVAMEVSSHALDMRRVDGVRYDVSAFTNLSEDHLDFHPDMESYFAAKRRLFDELTDRAVVVVDDVWGKRLAASLPGCITVSTTGADAIWTARDIVDTADGATTFGVRGPGVELLTACAIPGRYNVANAVLALAVLHSAGVDPAVAAPAIARATVPGRMERINVGQQFLAVVDYSHKPAAVEGALRALRPLTRGRLIIVLGCGGDRDRGKRAHMGAIAARDADLVVVTDDNPRSEDPAAIRRAMLDGARSVPAKARAEVLEVGGRRAAIETAVRAATAGDTVLIAGKGHETGQEIAGVVHPFDDRVELRNAIHAAVQR